MKTQSKFKALTHSDLSRIFREVAEKIETRKPDLSDDNEYFEYLEYWRRALSNYVTQNAEKAALAHNNFERKRPPHSLASLEEYQARGVAIAAGGAFLAFGGAYEALLSLDFKIASFQTLGSIPKEDIVAFALGLGLTVFGLRLLLRANKQINIRKLHEGPTKKRPLLFSNVQMARDILDTIREKLQTPLPHEREQKGALASAAFHAKPNGPG